MRNAVIPAHDAARLPGIVGETFLAIIFSLVFHRYIDPQRVSEGPRIGGDQTS